MVSPNKGVPHIYLPSGPVSLHENIHPIQNSMPVFSHHVNFHARAHFLRYALRPIQVHLAMAFLLAVARCAFQSLYMYRVVVSSPPHEHTNSFRRRSGLSHRQMSLSPPSQLPRNTPSATLTTFTPLYMPILEKCPLNTPRGGHVHTDE